MTVKEVSVAPLGITSAILRQTSSTPHTLIFFSATLMEMARQILLFSSSPMDYPRPHGSSPSCLATAVASLVLPSALQRRRASIHCWTPFLAIFATLVIQIYLS